MVNLLRCLIQQFFRQKNSTTPSPDTEITPDRLRWQVPGKSVLQQLHIRSTCPPSIQFYLSACVWREFPNFCDTLRRTIFLEHVVFGGFGMFDFCANVNFNRQYEGDLNTLRG